MSSHGYEIKTSFDFFRKMLDEREDFLKTPTSSRHAINCALTGWHLHEWVFAEYTAYFNSKGIYRIEDLRTYLYQNTYAFRDFRDLADGSKHFSLTHRISTIVNTELREAGTPWGLNRKLESDTLVVTTAPGVGIVTTFDDLLYCVSFFWYRFFLIELKMRKETEQLMNSYSSF